MAIFLEIVTFYAKIDGFINQKKFEPISGIRWSKKDPCGCHEFSDSYIKGKVVLRALPRNVEKRFEFWIIPWEFQIGIFSVTILK